MCMCMCMLSCCLALQRGHHLHRARSRERRLCRRGVDGGRGNAFPRLLLTTRGTCSPLSAQTAQWVMLGTRCRGPSLVCARCLYNPPRPPSVSSRPISTPTSEEQSADPAGSRSWTRRARSGTPGGKWCMPLRSATSSSSVFRGYRFAANSVMPETNEVSSIAARS